VNLGSGAQPQCHRLSGRASSPPITVRPRPSTGAWTPLDLVLSWHATAGSDRRTHASLPEERSTAGALAEALVRPPSGDARVLFFHLRDGDRDAFENVFRKRFGERFLLVSVEDALGLGLFGPPPASPELSARLGDLMAVADGVNVIEYVWAGGTSRTLSSIAHHSGLTPAELRVPLVLL